MPRTTKDASASSATSHALRRRPTELPHGERIGADRLRCGDPVQGSAAVSLATRKLSKTDPLRDAELIHPSRREPLPLLLVDAARGVSSRTVSLGRSGMMILSGVGLRSGEKNALAGSCRGESPANGVGGGSRSPSRSARPPLLAPAGSRRLRALSVLKLEDLQVDTHVGGIEPQAAVQILYLKKAGPDAVDVTYELLSGQVLKKTLFRSDEAKLSSPAPGASGPSTPCPPPSSSRWRPRASSSRTSSTR